MLPELTSLLILVPTTTSATATVTTGAPTINATETPRPTKGKQHFPNCDTKPNIQTFANQSFLCTGWKVKASKINF